jgi:nicotinic acetylcholine receptor, invertebrate
MLIVFTSDAGLYYGITIVIVSLATAMTVLTLNIHHKGEEGEPVPRYIKLICFGFLARLLCLKIQTPKLVETEATV